VPSSKPAPTPSRTRFGKNVANLRKAAGLTQDRLAERLGVSARYFQDIEHGIYFPSLSVLLKLRQALVCRWDELFDGCKPE
jgi:transcriptional regulator with XRE-family HTH domain